ncbi:MAG: nucleotidyltransferase domain-containing protein [Hyphomicrobiaceae bacterium]|nr:nucleotidyltransferase domain-containing protein [Hyphomicrobiaceae bacterium]
MLQTIEAEGRAIGELCRRHGVQRLEVFGSVATGEDTCQSDVDFIATLTPEGRSRAFDTYFGLREDLAALLGRPVDLTISDSIQNPYLRREIEVSRRTICAAPS